ncbi:hypothetical protein ABVT39_010436 [Epinephelus coioides]
MYHHRAVDSTSSQQKAASAEGYDSLKGIKYSLCHKRGQRLLKRGITMVGMGRKNRLELPHALLPTRDRKALSPMFAFTDATVLALLPHTERWKGQRLKENKQWKRKGPYKIQPSECASLQEAPPQAPKLALAQAALPQAAASPQAAMPQPPQVEFSPAKVRSHPKASPRKLEKDTASKSKRKRKVNLSPTKLKKKKRVAKKEDESPSGMGPMSPHAALFPFDRGGVMLLDLGKPQVKQWKLELQRHHPGVPQPHPSGP